VADGGYVLTNQHVIGDGRRVYAVVPGVLKPVPVKVLAADRPRDMALLKLPDEVAGKVRPLHVVADRAAARGDSVAAFGYPLSDALGTGLKLTAGRVSALPEKKTDDMILLDVKVNPGNSGGPLIDVFGNVAGMITAKSFSDERVDSFGMAITGPELGGFLRRHLPAYKPPPAGKEKMEWEDVDRLVSGSVLRILEAK
jgi:S1-C subfamily serine protease